MATRRPRWIRWQSLAAVPLCYVGGCVSGSGIAEALAQDLAATLATLIQFQLLSGLLPG